MTAISRHFFLPRLLQRINYLFQCNKYQNYYKEPQDIKYKIKKVVSKVFIVYESLNPKHVLYPLFRSNIASFTAYVFTKLK